MSSLREALKGSDIEAVRTGMNALAETLQRIATAAYQASASEAGPNGSGDDEGDGAGGTDGPAGEGSAEGEEAVEGEFKEV